MIAFLTLAIGGICLYLGGDALIKCAEKLARLLHAPPFFIASVILGFGSSMPELSVSIDAAILQHGDIVMGNIVGSNIANIALVLPLAALLHPIKINKALAQMETGFMLASTYAFVLLTYFSGLTRLTGALLFSMLCIYLYVHYIKTKNHMNEKTTQAPKAKPSAVFLLFLTTFLSFAMLIGGAHLFIQGAVDISSTLGIPKATIGLTVVAIGTALPEIIISVLAALRQQTDFVLGNLFGSCIFNVLGIASITALSVPAHFNHNSLFMSLIILLALSTVLGLFCLMRNTFTRRASAFFGTLYIAYMAYLFF